jgi:methionine-rich copper-binding protein CopC
MAPLKLAGHRAVRGSRAGAVSIAVAGAFLSSCLPGDGTGLDVNGRPPGDSGAGQPPPVAGVNDFRIIQDTILTPICTVCHAGAAAPLGLRLDAANSYAALVNVPSVQVSSLRRVLPGDPTNSYLLQKIEGRAAVGSRMPLGGPPLPQSSIDLVRGWIAAGARPQAAGLSAPDSMVVVSTIPAHGEVTIASISEITVVFNDPVDTGRAGVAGAVTLIAEQTGAPVALASVGLQEGNASVLKLHSLTPLPAGSYELRIKGTGAGALGSTSGLILDGDGDSRPGGDFHAAFLVTTGGAP